MVKITSSQPDDPVLTTAMHRWVVLAHIYFLCDLRSPCMSRFWAVAALTFTDFRTMKMLPVNASELHPFLPPCLHDGSHCHHAVIGSCVVCNNVPSDTVRPSRCGTCKLIR